MEVEAEAKIESEQKTPELAPAPVETQVKPKRTRIKKVAETTEVPIKLKEEKPIAAEAPKPKFDFKAFGRWSMLNEVLDQG